MKFITRILVLVYVTLVLYISCFAIFFVSNVLDFHQIVDVLYIIYVDPQVKMIIVGGASSLIFINFIFYRMFSVSGNREKIIAFDNPSGRVSVSLLVLEDLIKRTTDLLAEVREVKSSIVVSKKGLQIKIRLTLCQDVNIPEVTSRVQELVKAKIQDAIGIDEAVNISIYVGKILSLPGKGKSKEERQPVIEEPVAPNIPFQGYRA